MATVKERGFSFDIRQTNIAKGVAVLILLWHHLFRYSPKEFVDLIYIKETSFAYFTADFGHVCVAVFLILSGLGLYKSYSSLERRSGGKLSVKDQLLFVKNHLLKLMFSFWFIYLIFVPLGMAFGYSFIDVYQGNPLYMLLDFFGVAHFFKTPMYNETWWFMSIIILYYLLFPLLMKLLKLAPEILLGAALFINFAYFIPNVAWARSHFLPFAMGMILAHYNVIERISGPLTAIWKGAAASLLLTGAGVLFRRYFNNSIALDAMFGLGIVLFSAFVLSRIPVLRKILEEMGIYSSAVFMFHSFLKAYYPAAVDFIYWFKYVPLIFAVTVALCYGIARLLELFKHWIRYDRLVLICTGRKDKIK